MRISAIKEVLNLERRSLVDYKRNYMANYSSTERFSLKEKRKSVTGT